MLRSSGGSSLALVTAKSLNPPDHILQDDPDAVDGDLIARWPSRCLIISIA